MQLWGVNHFRQTPESLKSDPPPFPPKTRYKFRGKFFPHFHAHTFSSFTVVWAQKYDAVERKNTQWQKKSPHPQHNKWCWKLQAASVYSISIIQFLVLCPLVFSSAFGKAFISALFQTFFARWQMAKKKKTNKKKRQALASSSWKNHPQFPLKNHTH